MKKILLLATAFLMISVASVKALTITSPSNMSDHVAGNSLTVSWSGASSVDLYYKLLDGYPEPGNDTEAAYMLSGSAVVNGYGNVTGNSTTIALTVAQWKNAIGRYLKISIHGGGGDVAIYVRVIPATPVTNDASGITATSANLSGQSGNQASSASVYGIYYKKATESSWTAFSNYAGYPNPITGLQPCTTYEFKYFATGYAGPYLGSNYGTAYNTVFGPTKTFTTLSNAPATPGTISGSTTVCAGGGSQTYSISAVTDATSYEWTLPSGWSGSSTSTSILATPGSSASSGSITVKAKNSCGSSAIRSFAVTVNTPPTAPTSISATTLSVIEGASTTLTASGGSAGSGCTYQWGTGSCGSNIISGQTGSSITVTPTSTTTYWVRRVGNSACGSTTSCVTQQITWSAKTLTVSPTSYTFVANGGTSSTISITSNQSWTITNNSSSWLTTSKTSGSGNNTFTMTASVNSSSSSRTATVTITGGSLTKTISVTQAGQNSYSINVSASPSAGGTVNGNGTYTNGQTCTVTATANSGYSFTNWTENGTIISTSAIYPFTVTGNRTLVAIFTANTYTITFDAQGGYVSAQMKAVTFGEPVGGLPVPTKRFHLFRVWHDHDYSDEDFTASTVYDIPDDITLTAQYNAAIPIVTASYPADGGTTTGGGVFDGYQTCQVSATANQGYTFNGWSYMFAGNDYLSTNAQYNYLVDVAAIDRLENHYAMYGTEQVTLVANFTANTYTITLDKQNGSGGTSTVYEKYGTGWSTSSTGTFNYTNTITVPTRTGYTFGGYYTSTNGGGTQIITASGVMSSAATAFTANGTLYAKWTQSPVLEVSPTSYNFTANGGASSTITVTSNQSFWTVYDDASWLTTSVTSGSNNGSFTMTATANTSTSSRSATVTVFCTGITRTISVTQAGQTISAPTNDNCSGAISLSCGTTVSGTIAGATPTTSITYGNDVNGTSSSNRNDVFYKFTAANSGIHTVSLTVSNGDIDLELYSGCGSTSRLASLIYESTPMTYNCTAGTTYYIRATDYTGASGAFTIKVDCPQSQTWQIGYPTPANVIATLNNNVLTISGTGAMMDWGWWDRPGWDDITSVIINNGVTTVGTYAFRSCDKLTSVSLPNSLVSISPDAFFSCGLTSVNIPGSVTSIGEGAFNDCFNLTDVTVNWTTPLAAVGSVSFEEDMFYIEPKAKLHVPAGTECAYAAADIWKNFDIQNVERTITFDAQGGSVSQTSKTVKCQSQAGDLPTPTRSGYNFGGWWTVANGSGSQYSASTTVTGNITLYAKWVTVPTYTVSTSSNPSNGGSTTGGGSFTSGSNCTVTATANSGYSFTNWTENGTVVSTSASFAVTVSANRTLVANFTPNTYTITLDKQNGSGGTSTVYQKYGTGWSTSSTGTFNLTNSITVPTRTGYTFGGYYTATGGGGTQIITAAGVMSGSASTFTANGTLYAKWTAITYTVAYNGNGNTGGSTAQSSHTYDVAKNLTANGFTRTGYSFTGWATSVSGAALYSNSQSVINLTATNGETVNLYATWGANTYTINATAGSGGYISPSGTVTVSSGNSQTFTFGQNTNCYEISQVLINGSPNSTAKSNGSYTFTNVTSNQSISVTFSQKSYTITASAGSGGSISPSGSKSVLCGENQTYTITPISGYQISQVIVDGTNVGALSSYQFYNVTENHSISVTFSQIPPNTYVIKATAGSGGNISPSGEVNVTSGSSQTFTITPNSCYEISQVLIDGVVNSTAKANGYYTFTNVTSNRNISVSFTSKSYTITASAGSGGIISPSGNVSVPCGTAKTYTITPNSGYYIEKVVVDGVNVGAVSSYSFSNITDNHTITASFVSSAPACKDVAPLLTTEWDQCKPYNSQCPMFSDAPNGYAPYAPAGCVAIATAQIMKFWEHPKQRTKTIIPSNGLSSITGTTTYDWGIMSNTFRVAYSGNAAENAVAKLIKEVGYAVNMSYAANGSESNIDAVLSALPTYFNYSSNMSIIVRQSFNTTNNANWENSIKQELLAGRPVYYRGFDQDPDNGGGHAFVCDGYRCSDNKFHFNWGWGGDADGYYVTSLLTTSNGDFSSSQKIIVHIEPNDNDFSYPEVNNGTTTFAITSNVAGSNGSIIPSGNTYVYLGANLPYTFVANSGYVIDQVLIDGVPNATAKEDGYYIFKDVSSNHSITVTFKSDPTGLETVTDVEAETANKIVLYPNPVSNELFIRSALPLNKVEVYSAMGSLVLSETNVQDRISVYSLPAGIYMLKAFSDSGVTVGKFIKK
jgi:uncharacterized repeat protein (TIGR02543 family)